MILKAMMVMLGASLGALLRYAANLLFPQATLIVNILGSLLIGVSVAKFQVDSQEHLLISVGFLGGLTTFSAFSLELFKLFSSGEYMRAGVYASFSVLCCFLACALGFKIAN